MLPCATTWAEHCSSIRLPKPGSVRASSSLPSTVTNTNLLSISFCTEGRSASGTANSENVTCVFDCETNGTVIQHSNPTMTGTTAPAFTTLESRPFPSKLGTSMIEARFSASPKPTTFRGTLDMFSTSAGMKGYESGWTNKIVQGEGHGELLADAHLQQLCFDPDSSTLVFLVKSNPSPAATRSSLEEFVTSSATPSKEDNEEKKEESPCWNVSTPVHNLGEGYPGICGTQLVKLNTKSDDLVLKTSPLLSKEQLKDHPLVAYPCVVGKAFKTDGTGAVVFVSFNVDNGFRGLLHCFAARPNRQFVKTLENDGEMKELKLGHTVKHLVASPFRLGFQNPQIAYFDFVSTRPFGRRPHLGCAALCLAELDAKTFELKSKRTLVDIVRKVENQTDFPGLFPVMGNSDLTWLNEKTLLVGSVRRSAYVIYSVCIETGKVVLVSSDEGSWRVMCNVRDDFSSNNESIVVSHSQATSPFLASLKLISNVVNYHDDPRKTSPIYTVTASPQQQHRTQIFPLKSSPNQGEIVFHKSSVGKKRCVVFAHGGPHATDVNSFIRSFHLLLCSGYDILSVNYRGSLGWGQDAVECLLGNICDYEIQDVFTAVNQCYELGLISDDTLLFGSGGSHSGLMQCILVAKTFTLTSSSSNNNNNKTNTKKLSAAAIRNPVTDISAMRFETDIGDWDLAESDCPVEYYGNEVEARTRMSKNNPILFAGDVDVPILLGLGQGDLRVPPSQGRSWAKAVRHNKHAPEVQIVEYEKDNHGLDSPLTETEFAIQMLMFFNKYSS